uniref:Ankyrin repeat protein n=1 Tax=Megaviridae environmental sample TaxID=1737588 RepID=A0A5J6VMV1_9VIRU|nr:MAG: hypothetical protein [Megaviridae environmental sample]
MKINYVKFSKIKSKEQLKKYDLYKPIFLGNYVFHYFILTDNLKALQLTKYPVHFQNNDGYNGFILASKYNNYNILTYFIKTYPKYIFNLDKDYNTFLHYSNPGDKKYLDLVLSLNIKWNKLYQLYNKKGISSLDNLFLMGNYTTISKIIKAINFNYDDYLKVPYTFSIILNNNLNSKKILLILKEIRNQDKHIFKYNDNLGNNILYPIVLNNDIVLLKYFYKKPVDFNSYTPINTYHIFKLAYNKGIISKDYEMAKLIWDKIKNTHDFTETNKNGDNLVHYILKSRIDNNTGNEEIEDEMLKNYDLWNMINMEKVSPIDLITKLKFNKYSKYLVNSKIAETPKKITKKWREFLNGLEKVKNTNKIKLINTKYTHGNIFQARFTDTAIFGKYLSNKYEKLYFPILNKKAEVDMLQYTGLMLPADMLKDNLNFPWMIIWNDVDNYFIHPHLNKLIKKNKDNYEYGFVYLSLILPNGGLHASLIFYDFKNKSIERFDPYGNTMGLDSEMDTILEKELKIDNYEYIIPSRYLPVAGFQTISDENNLLNTKFGDFGGYCLAWCLWYIEHRLLNKNINRKVLIRKTLNKFYTNKYKPMEFIRNYANKINKFRVEYLVDKVKFPEKITSNEVLPLKYLNNLREHINNNF